MQLFSIVKLLFKRRSPVSLEQIPFMSPGETKLTTAAIVKGYSKYNVVPLELELMDVLDEYYDLYLDISQEAEYIKDCLHCGRELRWLQ